MTIGTPNLNIVGTLAAWTLEFFVRVTATSTQTICASSAANTFRISMSNAGALTLFLGQGTTFNIANGSAITGNLTTATYFHIALVYNGTNYVVYRNGTAALTVANSAKITSTAFNSLIFGGSAAAFNGQLDEIRISSIARYSTTFTPTAVAFVIDANTLALNHFENTGSATLSDDKSISVNNQMTYIRGGGLYKNMVFHAYAICNADYTLSGYLFAENSNDLELPAGYTNIAAVPFFIPVNGSTVAYPMFYNSGNYVAVGSSIPLLTGSTNVTPTITNTSLANFIPNNATAVDLLLTHAHLTTTSAGLTVGHNSLALTRTVMTTDTASTLQMTMTVPLATTSIDTFLTAAAGGTTYSVAIVGVYLP